MYISYIVWSNPKSNALNKNKEKKTERENWWIIIINWLIVIVFHKYIFMKTTYEWKSKYICIWNMNAK